MSNRKISFNLIKSIKKYEKINQFNDYNTIEYMDEEVNIEVLQIMKEGYEAMGEINLELAELPFESGIADINEYENWLCGVWYFEWQLW